MSEMFENINLISEQEVENIVQEKVAEVREEFEQRIERIEELEELENEGNNLKVSALNNQMVFIESSVEIIKKLNYNNVGKSVILDILKILKKKSQDVFWEGEGAFDVRYPYSGKDNLQECDNFFESIIELLDEKDKELWKTRDVNEVTNVGDIFEDRDGKKFELLFVKEIYKTYRNLYHDCEIKSLEDGSIQTQSGFPSDYSKANKLKREIIERNKKE